MVSSTELKIIKRKLGRGTGDILYQTEDGRWWEPWQGEIVGTGDEIRTKTNGTLK